MTISRLDGMRCCRRSIFSFEHDPIGKPASTFPDHALAAGASFASSTQIARGQSVGLSLSAGLGSVAVAVQPLTHFLAGLEKRHALLVDRYMGAGTRIAPGTGWAMFYRKRAETAQLDPIAPRDRRDDLIENRVHNVLHIPLIEMRVVFGDPLNKFGFDHRYWDPGTYSYAFP